jgi:hypothetical protein
MTENVTVSQGANDPLEAMRAEVEARFASALEEAGPQLAEAPWPSDWEVFAFGPFQNPFVSRPPGRIIALGEKAYIVTVVWMNQFMCENMAGFEAKISLSYYTSNTEDMKPVDKMFYTCCIPVLPGKCPFYIHIWEFEPTEAACILETNICAKVCNCQNNVVPGYAGFVRWVYDFDAEALWPAGPRFDQPIRYLVYDPDDKECDCSEICPPN